MTSSRVWTQDRGKCLLVLAIYFRNVSQFHCTTSLLAHFEDATIVGDLRCVRSQIDRIQCCAPVKSKISFHDALDRAG